ncbi:MAG: hypothetical protein M0R73_07635 [Dehalococcoidia bacterium]|nr:hypothetical protein [Dehalococcoidia bacterium]
MPQYIVAQHGDRPRYLVKALHEVARRIARLVQSMDDEMLDARADGDEWSVAQIIGYLRDAEREDYAALAAITRIDGSRIEERRAMHGPDERRYEARDVAELLWEFLALREETEWLLQSAGSSWRHVGIHPYRGEVELQQYVKEMNERDLDCMWRIQRARDLHRPPGAPQVTGAADI